jgi:hypothetical protein
MAAGTPAMLAWEAEGQRLQAQLDGVDNEWRIARAEVRNSGDNINRIAVENAALLEEELIRLNDDIAYHMRKRPRQ